MVELKICLVGFGNIARKYLRIIENISDEYNLKCEIDIIRSGNSLHQECPEKYKVITHEDKANYSEYDLVFIISTYPIKILHLKQFLKSKTIFIDKPVFTNVKEEKSILKNIDHKYYDKIFVGYCLRHHSKFIESLKLFKEKKSEVKEVKITYLTNMKNWRKEIDFEKSAGGKEFFNGGGAANELSHEIDLLFNFFDDYKNNLIKIETKWNYILNHDKSFKLYTYFKGIKYIANVDTYTNSNCRNIKITTDNGIYLFNLFLDKDIDHMYKDMILNLFLKAIDKKNNLNLPKIYQLDKITQTIEKIHKNHIN